MTDHGALMAMRTQKPDFTDGYKTAIKALRACARAYSPARYAAASAALQYVAENDEIEAIENDVDKLFAYGKVASDNTLQRLAAKVTKLHLAA